MVLDWEHLVLAGFDTETTGVDTENDRIVTAAITLDNGIEGQATTATWLINPGVEIPKGASDIHGITTEVAREHGEAPGPALTEIADLLVQCMQADSPIVVFNATFDLPLLDNELRRHSLPTLAERLGGPVTPVVDPLVLDRYVDKYRKGKRKLDALGEYYGVSQEGDLHTAEVDVALTLKVLRAMMRKHTKISAVSLEELQPIQSQAHMDWAVNFNEYLQRMGKTADVRLGWPYPNS